MVSKAKALNHSASASLFQRARQVFPGGVNSPVRAFKAVGMEPVFIRSGRGSRVYDVDGNEYIDYLGSWGPLILGHADEQVVEAVRRAAERGTSYGAPIKEEIELAETIRRAVPSVEQLRLVNSGNEATQGALRVARAHTGRDKVIKFAGCYHGSVDGLLVKAGSGATTLGVPTSPGVPAGTAQDTLTAEFNDLDSVQGLVEANPDNVAAIILEVIPGNMGVVPPILSFLEGLRRICDEAGIVLIFDEVMTGFRVAWGGAQALFEVTPDLTTFGKVIGGGMPVGAFGGRAEIMQQLAPAGPAYQAGTLSGNPVAMAAGLATLRVLEEESVYSELGLKSQTLVDELTACAQERGYPMEANAYGGMLGFYFNEGPVRNYHDVTSSDAELYSRFFRGMLAEGIYLAPSAFEAAFVSLAHSEADLERTAEAARRVMQHL